VLGCYLPLSPAIIAAEAKVPASHGCPFLSTVLGTEVLYLFAALAASFSPSLRVCFRSRTVKFFGELQIRSNWVSTSLIYFISSEVLGDYLNFTVLIKADLKVFPRI
jgi:hypothetical protein